MARKNRKVRIIEDVLITGIADKGKSVGRYSGEVIFIEGGIPGDLVDVRLLKKRKGVWNGRVETIKQASEERVAPVCEHFGICGGCKWQDLSYQAQLHHKQEIVKSALSRIGKIDTSQLPPIIGSGSIVNYRNKLEFSFSNKRWLTAEEIASDAIIERENALGFHRAGAFDKIVDIKQCHLQAEPSNAIRNAVKQFAVKHDYTFFDIREQVGLLRNMIVRTSSLGEVMVIISFFHEDEPKRIALLDHLKETFPNITSLQYVINEKKNDTLFDQDIITYNGRSFIYERLDTVQFKIGPKSFFQTNTQQALKLYQIVSDFAELTGAENVYDLYTGIGSIACFIANRCKQVTGIEEIEAAIEDAKENAALNDLKNTRFYAGDVRAILDDSFSQLNGRPDVVITDPPRAGMHADVVETLLTLEAKKLVYVSCNPATQARDLLLLSAKYTVDKIQAVDMFPHTNHVENVVSLNLTT